MSGKPSVERSAVRAVPAGEDRVGGLRRAVDEQLACFEQLAPFESELGARRAPIAVDSPSIRLCGVVSALPIATRPLGVGEHHVGERAADVAGELDRGARPTIRSHS